ncbi:MAG: malate synthase G, partial [Gammaproteobacteria bacterium]|nr:malate synthase G [Gammaproteobacteria bacterium]
MSDRIEISGLSIDKNLYELIEQEIAPGTGVDPLQFWQSLADINASLGSDNRELLNQRDQFQQKLDNWHKAHPGQIDPEKYQSYLREINYLVDEGEPFKVTTENVDDEIAVIAGPQLVVPVDNARYALNAANARWNSLY